VWKIHVKLITESQGSETRDWEKRLLWELKAANPWKDNGKTNKKKKLTQPNIKSLHIDNHTNVSFKQNRNTLLTLIVVLDREGSPSIIRCCTVSIPIASLNKQPKEITHTGVWHWIWSSASSQTYFPDVILILSFHAFLELSRDYFLTGFPTKLL
jgi:hypothetical protein